jgi:hypothetical protein
MTLPAALVAQRPVTLRVGLFDADGEQLGKGTVRIRLVAGGKTVEPTSIEPFDSKRYVFVFRDVPRQAMEVTAAHDGYEPQTFVFDPGSNKRSDSVEALDVRLARLGDAYLMQDGRLYAYRPHPTTIAVTLRVPADSMRRVFDSLGLRLSDGAGSTTVFLHKATPFDRWNSPELAYLRRHPGVKSAGPIRIWRPPYLTAFTDEIVVQFNGQDVLDSLRQRPEFAGVESSVIEPGKAVVRVRPEIGEGIVDLSRELSGWKGISNVSFKYVMPVVH